MPAPKAVLASCAFTVAASFLTVAWLSEYVGRRSMVRAQLEFIILLASAVVAAVVLAFMPQKVSARSGALKVLIPHVAVRAAATSVLVSLQPLTIAAWAVLVAVETGVT